jgi:hypothetical protein
MKALLLVATTIVASLAVTASAGAWATPTCPTGTVKDVTSTPEVLVCVKTVTNSVVTEKVVYVDKPIVTTNVVTVDKPIVTEKVVPVNVPFIVWKTKWKVIRVPRNIPGKIRIIKVCPIPPQPCCAGKG